MAIRGNIEFHGLPDVKRALTKASKRAIKAGAVGLYAVAAEIIKEAKHRAPVETGDLRSSGYATLPNGENNQIELGFGGPAEAYALIQHENVNYEHKVGEALYLLNAIDYILSFRGTATFARRAAQVFDSGVGIKKEVPSSPNEGNE